MLIIAIIKFPTQNDLFKSLNNTAHVATDRKKKSLHNHGETSEGKLSQIWFDLVSYAQLKHMDEVSTPKWGTTFIISFIHLIDIKSC